MRAQRLRPFGDVTARCGAERGDLGSIFKNLQSMVRQHGDEEEKFYRQKDHVGPAEMSAGGLAPEYQIDYARDHQERDAGPGYAL